MIRTLCLASLVTAGLCSAQGAVLGSFPVTTPNGILVGIDHDLAGNLLFSDLGTNAAIGVVDTTGTILSSGNIAATTVQPIGITTDGTNYYVTDASTDKVDVYDPAYNFVSTFSVAAQTTFPEGIAWRGTNNHLYVVDGTGVNQALEYDTAGTFLAAYPILGSSPDGLAWDAATDSFWLYDSGTDTIRNYDAAFNQLSSFAGTAAAGFGLGEGVAYVNGIVYVVVGGTVDIIVAFDALGGGAALIDFGTGCPGYATSSFYEEFTGPRQFDLASTSILLQLAGDRYVVVPWSGGIDPNFSNNLGLADDGLSTGNALGFTINTPVGPRSTIDIDSNGRAGFGLTGSDYTESVSEFIAQNLLCLFWDDLNPTSGGGVYFDLRPSYALITWDSVPEYSASGANTGQIKIFPTGDIEMTWGACSLFDCIVGWSDAANIDPTATDISTAIPFPTGAARQPLQLVSSARPVLNTTINLTTAFVPSNVVAGGVLAGFNQQTLDLTGIGMTNCTLLTGAQVSFGIWTLPSTAVPVMIPNDSALAGASMYWQSYAGAPGINPFGVALSQGLETKLGSY